MDTAEPDLHIITFNIKTGNCRPDSQYAWPLRRDFCLDIIAGGGYDFVGVQEAWFSPGEPDSDQAGDLAKCLPAYGMLGDTRDEDPSRGEGVPILYRRDRWEPDASDRGQRWLSETPGVRASGSWDTVCPRILVWGRFHELDGGRRTGRTVLFANTHLDYLYEHTALLQAALCDRLLADAARPGEPVVLTGDFNMWERSWPIRHLRGDGLSPECALPPAPLPLRDAWRDVHPGDPDCRTFHHWGEKATENRRIDYVFYAGGLRARNARIERIQRDGRFPSDHYPLSAAFDFA